ncbi:ANTH domain-containing protein [Fennellomyces sp. T-0311]|nr:ANTH domain-containing protein [Fennellomyces sp. T-0311]
MDTAVRKATRLDYQPPKPKHLNTLNALTFQYPASVGDIVDLLERRLKENSWLVTFKVLIILHTLMREGNGDKIIACIDSRPSALDTRVREMSSGTVHIQNIYAYTAYLQQKVHVFRQLGMDHVKFTMAHKTGKLRHLSVADGLLKETAFVQKLIGALLKCNFQFDDGENGIGLNAFRLLVEDMIVLFQTVNEAIVNILEHYFAMPKADARISLEIYKRFARQTEHIVAYLNRARILENELQITIPVTRHAPLSLATALAEYLNDAEASSSSPPRQPTTTQSTPNPAPATPPVISNPAPPLPTQQEQKPKELFDFFASLETEQVSVVQAPAHNPFRAQPTPSSSASTQHNPFRNTVTPQPSISTPTFNSNLAFFSAQQQAPPVPIIQQQPTSNNKFNPFSTNQPVAMTSHNPFFAQQQQQSTWF